MKPVDTRNCRVQILVCANERPEGRMACRQNGGYELFHRFKDKVRAQGLSATHWVTRTGCLGFCNQVGATVAIHRPHQDSRWFTEVTEADFDFLWNEIMRQ